MNACVRENKCAPVCTWKQEGAKRQLAACVMHEFESPRLDVENYTQVL